MDPDRRIARLLTASPPPDHNARYPVNDRFGTTLRSLRYWQRRAAESSILVNHPHTTSPPRRRRFAALAALVLTVGAGTTLAQAADPEVGAASALVPVTPTRIVDTRLGLGAPTGPTTGFALSRATLGVPAEATAVDLNLTVERPTDAGFVTLRPSAAAARSVSSLNLPPASHRHQVTVTPATRPADARVSHGTADV